MYGKTVDLVAKYKYLGVIFDEYLEYKENADVLASSGGWALGAVICKFKTIKILVFRHLHVYMNLEFYLFYSIAQEFGVGKILKN